MLSLKSGYPFGVVNKKIIYVNDEEDNDSENLSKIIDIGTKHKFELAIPQESFRMAIFAPSGAGKSTFCATVITNYKIKHKKNKVYMISPTKDDEAYDSVKNIEYIKIDDSILSDKLSFTEFQDCLIVFDDSELLSNSKPINSAIEIFRNQILENGRKRDISAIIINHVAQNGFQTKKVLNECNIVILYPKSNFSLVSRLTKQYYGFGKEELDYIRSVRSRWIAVKRSYPQSILSEHALKIV